MLISLFLFKTLEEYLLFTSSLPTLCSLCHLSCQLLCSGKGGQGGRNLGIRSIMVGGLLIRQKESEQEKGENEAGALFFFKSFA